MPSISREISYIWFEPRLDCAHAIEQFILLNRLNVHVILPIALSNAQGVLTLLTREQAGDSTASTVHGFRPDNFYRSRQFVYAAKGDDILPRVHKKNISVIKIDVEGAELEVMQGLVNTLRREKPFLFFEVLNNTLATHEPLSEQIIAFRDGRNREIMDLLHSLSYKVYNIREKQLIPIKEFTPEYSYDLNIVNYMAIHRDLENLFMNALRTKSQS